MSPKPALPAFLLTLALACSPALSLPAGPIRVSFLRDRAALLNTSAIMRTNGCTEGSIKLFEEVVQRYYATGFIFDLGKFPKLEKGFYSFSTTDELVASLPHKLCDTEHPWDFNCFDTAIMLCNDQLTTPLLPDDIIGAILVSQDTMNGPVVSFTATARDAFVEIYSQWYIEATKSIFLPSMQDRRMTLNAMLFRAHLLPKSIGAPALSKTVLEALRSDWRRYEVHFPKGFDLVLCHQVDFPGHIFFTGHAALLFHREKEYTYIEKAGGSGPFVRLDFAEKSDLLPWLAGMYDVPNQRSTHFFVSFNDTMLEQLSLPRKAAKPAR